MDFFLKFVLFQANRMLDRIRSNPERSPRKRTRQVSDDRSREVAQSEWV